LSLRFRSGQASSIEGEDWKECIGLEPVDKNCEVTKRK